MAKQKHYVVWKGRKPGIYTSWEQCKAQTDGFPGAKFKSCSPSESEKLFRNPPKSAKPSTSASTKTAKPAKKTSKPASKATWEIYCDGGCEPNPGPSGTGMVLYHQGKLLQSWCGHHESEGTNNRGEIFGLLRSLQTAKGLHKESRVPANERVIIHCDSQYAIDCITKWARNWRKYGWKTKAGEPVKNQDLIPLAFDLYTELHDQVDIRKVKGHSGVEGNELADQLATLARKEKVTGWMPRNLSDTQAPIVMDFGAKA